MSGRLKPAGGFSPPLLLLLSAAVAAEQPNSSITVRTTTRLIQVSVVAENWLGHRIDDLRQDDFHIYDNGRLQKIRYFEPPGAHPSASGAAHAAMPGPARVF